MLATHTVDPVDFLRVAFRLAARRIYPAIGRQPLTRRQREVYNYLKGEIDEHGYAPNFEEIARHFGFASLATVFEHVDNLQRKGWIARERTESRSIRIRCLVEAAAETVEGLNSVELAAEALRELGYEGHQEGQDGFESVEAIVPRVMAGITERAAEVASGRRG